MECRIVLDAFTLSYLAQEVFCNASFPCSLTAGRGEGFSYYG